ncbi:MAG: type II toxin-antitoxin system VapC family toxin [Bacteroidetes bacterium]|nr:MAG: type II toxin-antitoxin system VapC family toxin [Bacteroidota bacterium]
MENKMILVDTSILIELFRKSNKQNATLIQLIRLGYSFCISAVTEYEIYIGTTLKQIDFWNQFLNKIPVLPFDKNAAKIAVEINKELKRKRKLIDTADLFIAATDLSQNLPIATLNRKHFENIDSLLLIEQA